MDGIRDSSGGNGSSKGGRRSLGWGRKLKEISRKVGKRKTGDRVFTFTITLFVHCTPRGKRGEALFTVLGVEVWRRPFFPLGHTWSPGLLGPMPQRP